VGHGTVVVEDVHSNLYAAISRATRRFSLAASRELARTYHLTSRARFLPESCSA
jgi:hypothetical protein